MSAENRICLEYPRAATWIIARPIFTVVVTYRGSDAGQEISVTWSIVGRRWLTRDQERILPARLLASCSPVSAWWHSSSSTAAIRTLHHHEKRANTGRVSGRAPPLSIAVHSAPRRGR